MPARLQAKGTGIQPSARSNPIRTVIFDLGGVCFTDGTSAAVRKISARYGLTPKTVEGALRGPLGSAYRTGQIPMEQFWKGAARGWGIEVSVEILNRIWLRSYRKIPGTFTILENLSRAGCELLYLSDNVPERVAWLEERYGFLRFFKDGVFSWAVGLRKPDPRIYRLVLEKTSSPARECAYVDDAEEALPPAADIGMATVHFNGAHGLERQLHRLGLL